MMRSRFIYDKQGDVIYAEERGTVTLNKMEPVAQAWYYVVPDCQPFVSMVDGTIINSKSQYKTHLRDHGCIEVGNDRSIMNPILKPLSPPPGRKEDIIRAVNQLEERKRR